MRQHITIHAEDPKAGFTLGELRYTTAALATKVPDDTPIKAVIGWTGRIQKLTTEIRLEETR